MAITSNRNISETRQVVQRTTQLVIATVYGKKPVLRAEREELEIAGNEVKSRRELPCVGKVIDSGTGESVTLASGKVLLIDEIAEGVSLAIDKWSTE